MKLSRAEGAERAFKSRYNRTVLVEQGKEVDSDGAIKQADTKITFGGKEYLLCEYLKHGLTDYVDLIYDGVTHRYNSYLLAELHVADEIGKEIK